MFKWNILDLAFFINMLSFTWVISYVWLKCFLILYLVMENLGYLHVNIESNYLTDGYHTKTKTCYVFPRMWENICCIKETEMKKFAINQEKYTVFTLTSKYI